MCYLVREQVGAPEPGAGRTQAGWTLPRPRWMAAGAAALAAGIAFAAWFAPAPTATSTLEPQRAAALPVATQAPATPAEPVVVERIMIGVEDGIPVPPELAQARAGNCSESL